MEVFSQILMFEMETVAWSPFLATCEWKSTTKRRKNLFQCIHSALEMVDCLIIHKKAAVTTTEPQWKETLKIAESLPHVRKSLRSEHVLNETQFSTAA